MNPQTDTVSDSGLLKSEGYGSCRWLITFFAPVSACQPGQIYNLEATGWRLEDVQRASSTVLSYTRDNRRAG